MSSKEPSRNPKEIEVIETGGDTGFRGTEAENLRANNIVQRLRSASHQAARDASNPDS